MHRVRMLIHFGIIPYMVFDGDYLPSKAVTEVERAKKREESKRKGLEFYRLNKPSQAHLELQKAVDVTPEMARQLIDELKQIGVQYVVAPYEADAQLAYLERKDIIQGMISEDSDLLVFGAKRLLTKLDQYGDCIEISRADFTACREISLVGWSDTEFRRMAILSGCDYLASINRMGLKSAYRYVRKYKTIEKILQMLAFDGQYHIPTGYLEKFHKAELTFLHQRVFCPLKNEAVMMTDLIDEKVPADFSYIGSELDQATAIGVATGDLDPMTKHPIHVKTNLNSSPKTPWGNPRRNTIDTTSGTKTNKSIESFFKAKRTPLAELDPNSFTPSPTQHRLLQQSTGVSWSSSPATSASPSLRPNAPMLPSATRLPVYRDNFKDSESPGYSASETTASKRRRLCLELDDDRQPENSSWPQSKRSPFFSNDCPDPGPSLHNRSRKRGKEADITIWSDDSIEEAMAELPDVSDESSFAKTRKPEVGKDDISEKPRIMASAEIVNNERTEDDSQFSNASTSTNISEISTSTPATSVTSSTASVAQVLDKHVTTELKALAATYTYVPSSEDTRVQREDINDREDRKHCSQPCLKPQLRRQQSMTPLQRLGAGALNRSKSYNGCLNSKVHESSQSKEQISGKIEHTATNPPSLPASHTIGPDASAMKGSEDAMVPDSEDSAEDYLSDAENRAKPRIDLGRFAFAE